MFHNGVDERSPLHVILLRLIAAAAILMMMVSTPAAADGGDAVEQAIADIEQLRQTLVTVDLTDRPLAEVVRELSQRSPVPIRVQWRDLDLLDVRPETPVDLQVDRQPMTTALASIAMQLSRAYDPVVWEHHAGHIVICPLPATGKMALPATYDIRDLLAHAELGEALRARVRATAERVLAEETPSPADEPEDGDSETDEHADSEAGGGAAEDEGPESHPPVEPIATLLPEVEVSGDEAMPEAQAPQSPAVELMRLLVDHVDPDAWLHLGGSRAQISELNGALLVSAPPTIHLKLRETIRQLRLAHPTGLRFEAAVVDVPGRLIDRLSRRHEPGSIALGRALLGEEDAMILWQVGEAAAAMGETYRCRTQRGEASCTLTISPSRDPETGVLRLGVEVSVASDDAAAEVVTELDLPRRDSAGMVEVGAVSDQDDRRRVLIILPTNR